MRWPTYVLLCSPNSMPSFLRMRRNAHRNCNRSEEIRARWDQAMYKVPCVPNRYMVSNSIFRAASGSHEGRKSFGKSTRVEGRLRLEEVFDFRVAVIQVPSQCRAVERLDWLATPHIARIDGKGSSDQLLPNCLSRNSTSNMHSTQQPRQDIRT